MDPYDHVERESEQGDNREDPGLPEIPALSKTQSVIGITLEELIEDQNRRFTTSLGAIMAQLPT